MQVNGAWTLIGYRKLEQQEGSLIINIDTIGELDSVRVDRAVDNLLPAAAVLIRHRYFMDGAPLTGEICLMELATFTMVTRPSNPSLDECGGHVGMAEGELPRGLVELSVHSRTPTRG
jgi:hypothetical protein